MKRSWNMDYRHAARPPPTTPDIAKHAADTLITWALLLFFCVVIGAVLMILGVGYKK